MNIKRPTPEISFARAQGRLVYELRQERDITRKQLEELSGVNHKSIFRIEMGDSTARAYDLACIAKALDVSLARLFPPPEKAGMEEVRSVRTLSTFFSRTETWSQEGACA